MGNRIMSSIIRATTSSGLQVAPDNSGSLQLQTNGTTTAVTIDTSQNVGIGTTSPSGKLEIKGTQDTQQWLTSSGTAQYSGGYFNLTTSSASTNYGQTSFQHILNTGAGDLTDTYLSIQQRTTAGAYVGNIYQYSYKNQTSVFFTNNIERMRIDANGNVGVGVTPSAWGTAYSQKALQISTVGALMSLNGGTTNQQTNIVNNAYFDGTDWKYITSDAAMLYAQVTGAGHSWQTAASGTAGNTATFTERARITSNGDFLVGKTGENDTTAGMRFTGVSNGQYLSLVRDGNLPLYVNRLTNDGALVQFAQANTVEGTISVSGTTVSYGGGHIARWSQLYNETTKVEVYRGTVLESVDAMCEWYRDGQLLPNEQATKTIISTTVASKKIAGVFDIYDEDDEANPYDFFVAQSGDFVIRIAQGVTVQNGDLLESAGDGTAKPQADDICRSSTIAKVTSNYVSVTYEDGSYCVPCILMIG
jgi:hypothetical protein